jgi:hypothetical protein
MSDQPRRRYVDPIKYVVGTDLPHEKYTEALEKIALWYEESRPHVEEPLAAARKALQECLDGLTQDGQPWFAAANATLVSRVRSKCRFDLNTMQPLRNASDANRARRKKEQERVRKIREANRIDPMLPNELRDEVAARVGRKRQKVRYGDDPHMLLSSEERRYWQRTKNDFVRKYPEELGSLASQAVLDTLCDLFVLNQRHRLALLNGDPVNPLDRKTVVEQIDKLMTSLGIHPNQLAKKVQARTEATIGAAAKQLEQVGDWRRIRQRFFVEEMIQIYQMYMTLSADGLGYQLDDVGLYGLTKCRTCACSKCKTRNFVGINEAEVREYLIGEGVLKPVAEVPTYEPTDDVAADDTEDADPDAASDDEPVA